MSRAKLLLVQGKSDEIWDRLAHPEQIDSISILLTSNGEESGEAGSIK